MDGGSRVLWRFVAMTLLIGFWSCVYTEQTKIMPPIVAGFKGESRYDPSLLQRPPQTVAVLPFVNRTDKKEAFNIVRKSFHGHFSSLNYAAIPLFKVDDALRQAGLDTPEKVAQASPQKLREVLHTDALIRGEITHYDRVYVGVYSQVAVGSEVRMMDAKSGKELWWGKDVSRKHAGGFSTTPVGLILTAVGTAMNMRDIELLRSSDDLFRSMVKTMPQPTIAQALRPPNITILVHDGMRRTDKYANRGGDVIKVAMEGDPRLKASFSIGNLKKEIPMKEEEPGNYAGSYKVMPGDNVEEALITGTLKNDIGNSIEWVDVLGPVTVDTTPPDLPKELKARGGDQKVELNWAKNVDKDIARYKMYRSPTPLTGYQELGTTEFTSFQDLQLKNETSYYYKISALDLAGNESKLTEPMGATPVTPGPTPVRGVIADATTWYAGASPYMIEGEVIVAPQATLTIEPGTVIRSRRDRMVIQGKLLAKGVPNNLITFEGASPGQNWGGIVFDNAKSEENVIEFARVTGATVGITCHSSSPLVAHNDLSRNQVGIRVQESFSQPKIVENVIASNQLAGVEIMAGGAPLLEGNEIRGNQKDGVFSRESRPSLEKNRILNNGETGVRLFSSPARLRNNNIHDNGQFEIFNAPEKDVPVEALENWWGAKEGSKIVNRISGRVDYQRILDGPYPQGKPVELPILKSPLGGQIQQDSFLTLGSSPYILEKDLVLEKGATLFLQPGVTLRFNPGTSILIKDGGIDARGTADRVITFTSNSSFPSPGSYPSVVRFEQPSRVASFFRYCILEYSETGLDIAHGAPELDHCLIGNHSQVGMRVSNDAEPKVSYSTFFQNRGTGAVVVQGTGRPKMNRNNFIDNSFAIQSFSSIYLDARENWWGSSPPPGSLFLGQVNYKPWLEGPEAGAFQGRRP